MSKNSPMKGLDLSMIGAGHGLKAGIGKFAAANPAALGIMAGLGFLGMLSGRKKRRQRIREAQREVKAREQDYLRFNITNPYEGMANYYKGAENVMEDLTVNQKQAEFMSQQSAQQRADIMAGLRGAAGASGLAGLAQSLAQQGTLQAAQASATIGQQEAMNQRLAAQEASRLQQLERSAQMEMQMKERYGAMLQETREQERVETLYAGALTRASEAQNAQTAHTQNIVGGVSDITSAIISLGG